METNNQKYSWEQLEVMMANLIISQQHTEKILNQKFQEVALENDKRNKELDKKFQEIAFTFFCVLCVSSFACLCEKLIISDFTQSIAKKKRKERKKV